MGKFEVGDRVKVSDGTPPPTNLDGAAGRAWRSHNFTGRLVEKIDGDWRRMRIELPPEPNFTVAYDVAEAVPHTFDAQP